MRRLRTLWSTLRVLATLAAAAWWCRQLIRSDPSDLRRYQATRVAPWPAPRDEEWRSRWH